ncbi:uncharacterized protein METZ01_LOCUS327743, partial [marine metagenome]
MLFQFGDLRVRVSVTNHAQACLLLAQDHGDVLRAAKPDTDNRRLAGETAFAKSYQAVDIKTL